MGGKQALDKLKSIESDSKVHEFGETPGYLIGTLVRMDFIQKTFSLKLLNGRIVQAIYQDDFEPTLLENARRQIQIHGNIQYDDKNEPTLISDVDDVTELDLTPITIRCLEFRQSNLLVSPPLVFEPQLDEENFVLSTQGEFNIFVCAQTRSDLEDELDKAIKMLWLEYALEDDDALSPKAIELAKAIRQRITEGNLP